MGNKGKKSPDYETAKTNTQTNTEALRTLKKTEETEKQNQQNKQGSSLGKMKTHKKTDKQIKD